LGGFFRSAPRLLSPGKLRVLLLCPKWALFCRISPGQRYTTGMNTLGALQKRLIQSAMGDPATKATTYRYRVAHFFCRKSSFGASASAGSDPAGIPRVGLCRRNLSSEPQLMILCPKRAQFECITPGQRYTADMNTLGAL
jgi:hypothetical protein